LKRCGEGNTRGLLLSRERFGGTIVRNGRRSSRKLTGGVKGKVRERKKRKNR